MNDTWEINDNKGHIRKESRLLSHARPVDPLRFPNPAGESSHADIEVRSDLIIAHSQPVGIGFLQQLRSMHRNLG